MSFFKKLFSGQRSNKDAASHKSQEQGFSDFENVKSSIFPYFKQLSVSNDAAQKLPEDLSDVKHDVTYEAPGVELVIKHICEDLNCLYVIDSGNDYKIIQQRHLSHWQIDQARLEQIALDNLTTLAMTNLSVKGDSNGLMFVLNGNLEAAIVLMDQIWIQLEEQIGEAIVIAVPSRDVLLATGASNETMLESFAKTAADVYKNGDYPLSRNLFIRDGGVWKLFRQLN
jgi:uncharacterized protein YtpQ (UPF0354 family)